MTRKKSTQAETKERLRARFEAYCNHERTHADEIAAQYACDDPLHPHCLPQVFRDWHDFVDRVCVPLVEQDGEAAVQAAMKLYRQASPYFICVSLYMASKAEARP